MSTAKATDNGSATISSSNNNNKVKVIDSHLHVWANTQESKYSFPLDSAPPDSLKEVGSTTTLMEQMKLANVDGCLIVQPINHKYDHSYVAKAIRDYPDKFKGMLLHDPSITDPQQAVSRLEELSVQGFCGVRFNPYLFEPSGSDETSKKLVMSRNKGAMAVYKRCADLYCPVAIMCFKGLHLHYEDIIALLEASPKTNMILDHFGFTSLFAEEEASTSEEKDNFSKLLALAKYPQVYVKISALFRVDPEGAAAAATAGAENKEELFRSLSSSSYSKLKRERFDPLLESFGSHRLLFGTDFPFVLEQPGGYKGSVDLVKSWLSSSSSSSNEKDCTNVMSGTAEKLFGVWGEQTY